LPSRQAIYRILPPLSGQVLFSALATRLSCFPFTDSLSRHLQLRRPFRSLQLTDPAFHDGHIGDVGISGTLFNNHRYSVREASIRAELSHPASACNSPHWSSPPVALPSRQAIYRIGNIGDVVQ
jgi:hypothetical protein